LDRRPGVKYAENVQSVHTPEEIVKKTVNTLENLGNQVFALSPFSAHFNRWLTDLNVILSEFESDPAIGIDDEFLKERSRVMLNVESQLEKLRSEEGSFDPLIKKLSASRASLEDFEKKYAAERKELAIQKEAKTKAFSDKVDLAKKELEQASRIRTGFFRGVSKKAKAQKEKEATERVNLALAELSSALKTFDEEEASLNAEYEAQENAILNQIQQEEKEVECKDTDGSLQVRKRACSTLVNQINEFVERKNKLLWSF
jgi:hypothetical protein